MFDEMCTGVFIKEVEETSLTFSFVTDLEAIESPKALNKILHSCCHKVVAEVQPKTPIKTLDDKSLGPERNKVQLFDECFQRDMSKRYITATYMDHSFSKHEIEFETFDDIYLPEFSL
ncbi:hypothetical protein H5410_056928 [Solanum commersonii]|uniref:Uncharacterized protein n=1 Tax=Solanum commersonii TaxID=4109 RepID=A0A9J5WMN4_SOLCO|nr:hypothetical protein H5410_056928 [Solanum commersonii]